MAQCWISDRWRTYVQEPRGVHRSNPVYHHSLELTWRICHCIFSFVCLGVMMVREWVPLHGAQQCAHCHLETAALSLWLLMSGDHHAHTGCHQQSFSTWNLPFKVGPSGNYNFQMLHMKTSIPILRLSCKTFMNPPLTASRKRNVYLSRIDLSTQEEGHFICKAVVMQRSLI